VRFSHYDLRIHSLCLKRKLPQFTTLHTVILASDKTHLTNYSGDKSMHVVLLTLGNIRKSVRRKINRNAYILLAEIPSPKFENTRFSTATEERDMPGILRRQLFHECMSVVLEPLRRYDQPPKLYTAVDPDGFKRKCAAILAGWIADMEEVWMILGIAVGSCPKCLAHHETLDSLCEQGARTSASILGALASVREQVTSAADTWQFVTRAKEFGLFGIEKLCWEGLGIDICQVICFDALHTLHKGFFDHLFGWITRTIGELDLDNALKVQPHSIGKRNFHHGVSHLSQLSGREHRDLQRHILPAIADHPNAVPRVLKAVRAFLDFSYKVQFPLHTDTSLKLLEKDLEVFYQNYDVFISNGARKLDHMKIPKLHYLRHASSNIKHLGALDSLSTETLETLHRLVKAAYPLTNRKQFKSQIIRILQRTESVRLFSSYLRYTYPTIDSETLNNPSDGESDSDSDDGAVMERTCVTAPSMSGALHQNPTPIQVGCRSLEGVAYKLSIKPHTTIEIGHLTGAMSDVDVISPFIWFFNHGEYGDLHRTQRSVYQQHDLPAHLKQFDLWLSFKFQATTPNKFYQPEMKTIHCDPGFSKHPIFDPVVIETLPNQSGLKCTCLASGAWDFFADFHIDLISGYRIARICFVFSLPSHIREGLRKSRRSTVFNPIPTNDPTIDSHYAFVLWFEPISSPVQHSKLRTVKKMIVGNQQATGIVHLKDIKFTCELSPVLSNSIWDGAGNQDFSDSTSLDTFDNFYVNCFGGHLDYELFA
jgi:hypothetical protein